VFSVKTNVQCIVCHRDVFLELLQDDCVDIENDVNVRRSTFLISEVGISLLLDMISGAVLGDDEHEQVVSLGSSCRPRLGA
jgi:hypothetical protein